MPSNIIFLDGNDSENWEKIDHWSDKWPISQLSDDQGEQHGIGNLNSQAAAFQAISRPQQLTAIQCN